MKNPTQTQNTSPFSTPDYIADPYQFYAQLRNDSPVSATTLPDGTQVYLVTRFADVLAGLKDSRFVKNIGNARPEMKHVKGIQNQTLLKADPPEHARLRALSQEAFKPKFVNQMRAHIQEIADGLIDAIQDQGEADFIESFALPLPIIVICEILGIPPEDNHLFREWSTAFTTMGLLNSEDPMAMPEMGQLAQYLNHLVEQRQKDPKDDFVTDMIRVEHDGDKLGRFEIISTLIMMLVAGHETTVNLIGNGMLELLKHRDQLENLKADPTLISSAVEELLRFVNPIQFVNRYAAEDIVVGEVTIPQGSHVLLLVAAANYDTAYLQNPEALNLTQGDSHHLAFGQGIHYCLGAPLARLEGEIAFTTILRRLPNIRLAIAPDAVQWRSTLTLRGLASLPVEF
ncbi:MAG: cytochrome P450 [Chloroflexota bacterium]